MTNIFSRLKEAVKKTIKRWRWASNVKRFKKYGMIPWSRGYQEYKTEKIIEELGRQNALENLGKNFGINLDERIVEYAWIFSKLTDQKVRLLDAGSTLNHDFILSHPKIKTKDLTICTFHPENYARHWQRISYVYEDLRVLPFRDNWFNEIVCISTLEHIDMDNSIYGYESEVALTSQGKSYSYLIAIREMNRVLEQGGKMFVTVPFGKFENHGFFQQFDKEMISRLKNELSSNGEVTTRFFKYQVTGWHNAEIEDCLEEESFNPHTGRGKKNDGAAHSRAICCISFLKLVK